MSDEQQGKNPEVAKEKSGSLSRRSLMAVGGAATLAAAPILAAASPGGKGGAPDTDFDSLRNLGAAREKYWRDGGTYFVQDSVDISKVDQGVIRARVDGEWRDYVVREIDDMLFGFNIGMRRRMLGAMMANMAKMSSLNQRLTASQCQNSPLER